MDMTLIIESLNKIFKQENYRIVFWYDPEREFESEIDLFQIEDAELIRLDLVGHLTLKIRMEIDEPERKFLLYSPTEKPDIEEDFLLDLRYFSYDFHADRSSILLNELGLAHQYLINHLKLRQKFFDSKERINHLKKFVNSGDTENDLDRKMLAVVTKSSQDDFSCIVRSLFQSYAEQDNIHFETSSDTWKLVEKYGLNDIFWKLSEQFFAFKDPTPTLQKLLIQLFVSDFVHRLNNHIPSKLENLRLPAKGELNTVAFFAQWRDSISRAGSYNKLAEYAAEKLFINETLEKLPLDLLLENVTFSQADDQILQKLFKHFNTDNNYSDAGFFRTAAVRRQQEHWIRSPSVSEQERHERRAAYELIALAAEISELARQYSNGFNIDTAAEMFRLYTNELYKFDQLYRRFHRNAELVNADQIKSDQVKTLCEEIDNIYHNKYLIPLALKWNRFLENGLLEDWNIAGVSNQYEFYDRFVANEAEEHRVFVIISDAFRYADAEELKNTLNGRDRFHAEITAMLGVVPSYTALGMAALLPHDQLTYNNNGDILADGRSATGLENRNAILAESNGIAVQTDNLLAMKRDKVRKLINNKIRVVYLYHNVIDSHGDSVSTEGETFQATDVTIDELAKLVQLISNDLSGSHIIVTSDHGFVYTESYPTETNKSKNESKTTNNIIKAKKRYFIGHNLTRNNFAWFGNTKQTAKCNGAEFGIAKGYSLFHFSGSTRYFHGGAMLHEIVIPVVVIRPSRSKKDIAKTKIKNVSISILGNRFKITTAKHRFQFIQTEPISDRVKSITVKMAIYDTNNQPVSSIETLTFNSTSENLDERQQSACVTLQSHSCDKSEKYYLILRDVDSNIEILSQEIIIDRVIAEDFN
ncbi:MAG: BREX-1 system phosphatase PglZ type A [Planctomycetaceae bacterium]|jgi:uncharacterized protein (TIGR02687 family)|nr:BREX-1 system phosphatase PglZ type A [Planctomycetaceae bacterium]